MPDEIKKACRLKVMKRYPDAGGLQVEFIAMQAEHVRVVDNYHKIMRIMDELKTIWTS